MNIIVTVDTEADNQWLEDASATIENVFQLPRFQELCDRYGIIPTYFTTYEVATDARAAAMLRDWQEPGKAEIGAHLHPWTTPPFFESESGHSFPSELSDESLRQKFAVLTEFLERQIGRRPTSYRAGRWGFDMRQASLLDEYGYLVDSSITPGISWASTAGLRGGAGGPDFSRERTEPHMLNGRVLEVPMTLLRAGFLRRRRWLRIFKDTGHRRLISVLREADKQGLPAVFMIHSSELVAGKSPYVPDTSALAHVYECLEHLFLHCGNEGIKSVALSQYAREFAETRSRQA